MKLFEKGISVKKIQLGATTKKGGFLMKTYESLDNKEMELLSHLLTRVLTIDEGENGEIVHIMFMGKLHHGVFSKTLRKKHEIKFKVKNRKLRKIVSVLWNYDFIYSLDDDEERLYFSINTERLLELTENCNNEELQKIVANYCSLKKQVEEKFSYRHTKKVRRTKKNRR